MDKIQQELNIILMMIGRLSILTMAVPVTIAIIKFRILNKPLKYLLWFSIIRLVVSLITQIIIWATFVYKSFFKPILNELGIHNMSFISILAHLNYFCFLGLYFSLVIQNVKIKKVIKLISIILFFCALINYLFIEGYKQPSIFNSISSNIFCFILPLIHLWFLYSEDSKVPINRNPYFWVSLGLIIPNLIGLIMSITAKKLRTTDLTLYLRVDIGFSVLQIIGYLIIAIGFYYARYTKYMPKATT